MELMVVGRPSSYFILKDPSQAKSGRESLMNLRRLLGKAQPGMKCDLCSLGLLAS